MSQYDYKQNRDPYVRATNQLWTVFVSTDLFVL